MNSKRKKDSEVISVLSMACAQNSSLDLRIVGDRSRGGYKSRFLSIGETREELVLVIEAPTSKGSVVPVRPGRLARVLFPHEGRNLLFKSRVLRRGRFRLNSEVTVPSLELSIPEEISSGEMRNFYRLFISGTPPIEIRLGIFAEQKGRPRRIRSRETGVLTDIGGGGLGFHMPEGRSLLISVGTLLSVSFRFRPDGEQIKILGRVCFSLRSPKLRKVFYGVQFVELDSKIEYKQSADRILRYVADRQRESLAGRIHLEH